MIDYAIFEKGTIQETLKGMLETGYIPLNVGQIWKLAEDKELLSKGCTKNAFNTRTAFINGEIRDATLEDLNNIKQFYEEGGRLLSLSWDNDGYEIEGYSFDILDCICCFIGARPDAKISTVNPSVVKPDLEQVLVLDKKYFGFH